MKIFSEKTDDTFLVKGIRLNKKETKKILNPTKEYIQQRNLILKKIDETVEKKDLGNGIIKVSFKK